MKHPKTNEQVPPLTSLLNTLGELIRQARQQALRAVDAVQVRTCWEIGRHIVEFEQGGEARAAYGKKLLPTLAKVLTEEYPRTTALQAMKTEGSSIFCTRCPSGEPTLDPTQDLQSCSIR